MLTFADNSVSKVSDGSAVDTTIGDAFAIGSTIKVPGNSDTANWIATSLLDGFTQGVTSSSQQNMTSKYIVLLILQVIYTLLVLVQQLPARKQQLVNILVREFYCGVSPFPI